MSPSNNTADNDKPAPEPLPDDFTPGDRDVVIGKGKKYFHHAGNRNLRDLIATMLDEYSEAQTKPDKSNIITDVVEHVRKTGRFVRRDAATGGWVHAEDLLCREKCSQTFRDHLAQTYRSSNTSKKNKRRFEVEMQFPAQEDGFFFAPQPKRFCPNPEQRSPMPTFAPQHLFEWEMSPLSPEPRIFQRRVSGFEGGNLVNLLADALGDFYPLDNENEDDPFEPTPLAPTEPSCTWPSLSKREASCTSYEEPMPLLGGSFQPLRTTEASCFDEVFAPDISCELQQPQWPQSQGSTSEDFGVNMNVAAAFAA